MRTKTITIITALTLSAMLLASNGFADIPAPPVNQKVAMPDTVLNDLVEAECRACHEDNPVDPTSIPDRHHLLYGSSIIYGECENSGNTCLIDADCAALEVCVGQTAAPYPYASTGVYGCLSCHEEDTSGGTTNFLVERDCLVCHFQVPGEASVHHLTPTAQGTDSPLGDPLKGDCTPCHGTFVDDYGDDAIIPTYAPSLVTPTVREGTADEMNIEGSRAGGCTYCHTSGTGSSAPGVDDEFGVDVYKSGILHHTAGVYQDRYGNFVNDGCEFCHGNPINFGGDALALRNCEECHGYESLHNIQADSPNAANIGTIVVGEEDYGYGHIGIDDPAASACSDNGEACSSDADCTQGSTGTCNAASCGGSSCSNGGAACTTDDDCTIIGATCDPIGIVSDCWGCHGFGFNATSAPAAGPVTPTLSDADKQVIVAGTDTEITLSGSSLTNSSGTTEFLSSFILTAKDGTVVEITPTQINAFSSTIIIPGTTAQGNYLLTAVKDNGAAISNPVPISIKPLVKIEEISGDCSPELTIKGSGFGAEIPDSVQTTMNVKQNDVKLTIASWIDTEIVVTGAVCDGSEITVNGLFGSATK